jgi:hypothetical protein
MVENALIRPVTPEVASSSLVAPANKQIRGLGIFSEPLFLCPKNPYPTVYSISNGLAEKS